jgi:hypothetical protein
MWRNPRYPAPGPATPPEDTGRRLASLPRGNDAELRVTLATYEGRPYCALRVWDRGSDGQFWPSKRGCSVRLSEVADVIAALRRAEDLAADESGQSARQDGPGRRPAATTAQRPSAPTESHLEGERTPPDDRPCYVEPRRRRPQPRAFNPSDLDHPTDGPEFDEFQ